MYAEYVVSLLCADVPLRNCSLTHSWRVIWAGNDFLKVGMGSPNGKEHICFQEWEIRQHNEGLIFIAVAPSRRDYPPYQKKIILHPTTTNGIIRIHAQNFCCVQ